MSTRLAQGPTGKLSWTKRPPKSGKLLTMTSTRTNLRRPLSVPLRPTIRKKEVTGEAGSPFSRVGMRGRRKDNKAQQAGRPIHPPIRDKDGNLQPHSP